MSIDFNAPEGSRTPENEANLFAPTPVWARESKKRRGRRVAARSQADPAIDAGEAGAGAGVMGATTAAEPADATYETQSARTESGRARRGGVSGAAIFAGVAAAAILAGVGWYASQQHRGGLAVLTPGGTPAATQTALATPRTPPGAQQLPITRVSDPATPANSTPPAEPSAPHHKRARSHPAASAGDGAANTSAVEALPATPTTAAGTASQTETTNLNPLAGTTSPVPAVTTPSASSAEPGSSPAATPSPAGTP